MLFRKNININQWSLILSFFFLINLVVYPGPVQAEDFRFFSETGHSVSGKFLQYWNSNGGLSTYGFPITDAQNEVDPETGKTFLTQWFERNRFELHPENAGTKYEVLLGLLGKDLNRSRLSSGPFGRTNNTGSGNYYNETGHNLGGRFREYWSANGGLERFGFPISEEFQEVDPETGKTFVMQWFERARFEKHPENARPYDVLLGLLGKQIKGGNQVPTGLPGKIIYGSTDGGIYLINPDSSGRTRIANGTTPVFSPDGKRIAYVVNSGTARGNPPLQSTIVSSNLDGSGRNEYCTVSNNTKLYLNRWSPDGNYIGLVELPEGVGIAGIPISICNLSTKIISGPPVIAPDIRNIFDWAPDGVNLLFQFSSDYNDYKLIYGPGVRQTENYQVTNGQYRKPVGYYNEGLIYQAGRISPDGKAIAVAGSKLFTVNVPNQQSDLSGKVFDEPNVHGISWSPDGQALAIVSVNENYKDALLKVVDFRTNRVNLIASDLNFQFVFVADWK